MNGIDGLMPMAVPIADYLLDSLVLGMALTGLVTLLLRLWRGLNPSTRYVVWLGALLAVVTLPMLASLEATHVDDVVPFISGGETASTSPPSTSSVTPPSGRETSSPPNDNGNAATTAPGQLDAEPGDDRSSSESSAASARSDASAAEASSSPDEWHLPAAAALGLVGLWALAALVALGRLARAYARLTRLRRASDSVATEFQRRWLDLARREGIRRTIDIRHCDAIASPMIAGCGRPALLLPSGLLDQISSADLDRLILHELAHVARWDDVLKPAQELIQALFVLHPAVGWIGRNLDVEREMACDDWAVTRRAQTRDDYVASLHALVRWAVEDQQQEPTGSDSALTARTELERRMRRMLRSTRTASARLMRTKLAGAIGLLLVGAGGLALTMPTLGVGSAGALGPLAASQPQACDVTLSPDQSIQSAIADADSGATICLESGEWQESVTIEKSLTLRGIGAQRSTVQATSDEDGSVTPTVEVANGSPEQSTVTLVNLNLIGSQGESGFGAGLSVGELSSNRTVSVTAINVRFANNRSGIAISGDNKRLIVQDSLIEANQNAGVGVLGQGSGKSPSLEMMSTRIRENGRVGVEITSGEVVLNGVAIRDHAEAGIIGGTMESGRTNLSITDSTIADNGRSGESPFGGGILLGLDIRAATFNAAVNAEVENTRIDGNQRGIFIGTETDLTLANSSARENLGWGVMGSVCLEQAGSDDAQLNGEIRFAGQNTIRDNNVSGKLDGQGNPGNHPFTELPDGQVCLPMGEQNESEEGEDSAQAVPAECTVALTPEESIQAAIDEASSGDTICLESGDWTESVTIEKSLALRGIGDERSTIQDSGEANDSVFFIRGEGLDIELRDLKLIGADSGTAAGIQVAGSSLTRSSTLTVASVRIEEAGAGLSLGGQEVSVQVRDSVVTNLGGGRFGVGIRALGDVELSVADTRIVDNNVVSGIDIGREATATVRDTTVQGNAIPRDDGSQGLGVGINVGEGHLRLIDSTVRDNGGLTSSRLDSVQNAGVNVGIVDLQAVTIAPSPATAEIVASEIAGNRHGLMLGPEAALSLETSEVRQNVGWGLATPLRPCINRQFNEFDGLRGDLEFAGDNVIAGNNTSGALDGQGNPGEHPFTNLPDGQVCLPSSLD